MSTSHQNNVSSPTFQSIFNAACEVYEKKTGQDLRTHPLAAELNHCNAPDTVLLVLQKQADALDQARNSNKTLIKWLNPTIHLLHMFSETIAKVVGIPFHPAKIICTAIGVLLQVAKDVTSSYDFVLDVFERIESFLTRLEVYSEIPLTTEMTTMLGKILAEVLTILALSTKEMKDRRIKKFVKRLVGKRDVENALQRLDKLTQEETGTAVASIKADTAILQRKQSRESLRSWLSPPNPSINHNIACASHHDTTATWFVHGNLFNEWKSSGSLLWVYGKPGCGKSILASTMIEDVKAMCDRGSGTFAYFYFDFNDSSKRDIRGLLSSILVQLCDKSDESWAVLSQLHAAHRDGTDQPKETALTNCLRDMLSVKRQRPTFIIVDAVDECPSTPGYPSARAKVLNLVKDLVNSYPDLRICVTSRPEQDIRIVLEPLTSRHISLHDQEGQKGDIANYVRSFVHSDRTMRKWRTEDKELVIDTLIESADGMFRWIFCQLEKLSRCFPSSIRQILDELPTTLDGTYERILLEIPEEKWKYAHRLLQCLVVSSRPLLVEELADILSIQFDPPTKFSRIAGWRPENTEDAVLSACSSLIAIVKVEEGPPAVQFAHFSVEEFLTSNRLATAQMRDLSRYYIALEPAHEILVKACLSTLLELDEHIDKKGLKDYPMALYAARHWFTHAPLEDVSSSIEDMMRQLFDVGKPHFSAWTWLLDGTTRQDQTVEDLAERPSEPKESPLYYSAASGLRSVTEHLISLHPNHVNPQNDAILAPFCGAISSGDVDSGRLLLRHGANVNYVCGDPGLRNWTLLHTAACTGDSEMVKLLLEYKAEVNRSDDNGESPLQIASKKGDIIVMQLLLECCSDVNHRKSVFGWTPLMNAVQCGQLEALRLLLQHNADVNVKDNNGKTALHWALSKEDVDAIQLLLKHGAEVHHHESVHGWTPLIQAVRNGRADIVRLLLQHKADVEATDSEGARALHWALYDGNLEVVQALLKSGANVDARDGFNHTPLAIALEDGYQDMTRLLLTYGARAGRVRSNTI